jgi:hypothetical protein
MRKGLPTWAKQRITELSELTGVSESQILEDAIRVGLPTVRGLYSNIIKARQTSEQLWNEDFREDSPEPAQNSSQADHVGGMGNGSGPSEATGSSDDGLINVRVGPGPETEDNENTESIVENLV